MTNYKIYRMLVWLFGLLCSPMVAAIALRKCATDHEEEAGPLAVQAVEDDTYVDDWWASIWDELLGCDLVQGLTKVLEKGVSG